MAKHNAPAGSGRRDQPDGRHNRQDQQFAQEGEQTWPVIQARLDAERLAASRERS